MATKVVMIDPDISELKAILRPMDEDYDIYYFTSPDLFFQKLNESLLDHEKESEKEEPQEAKGKKKKKKEKPFLSTEPIDLVLIDIDLLKENPISWVMQAQAKLQAENMNPEGGVTKFLFSSHETDHLRLNQFQHKYLYDFLYKPYDHPLLLQKISTFSQLPQIVGGDFLYQHKTEGEIEVFREVQMLEISEYGISLLNPSPVRPGSFASFRLASSSQAPVKFLGRCHRCQPADVADFYKCSFSYFGIGAADLRKQRELFMRLDEKKDNYNFEDQNMAEMSEEARAIHIRQQILNRAKSGPGGRRGQIAKDSNLANDAESRAADEKAHNILVIDMDQLNIEAIHGSLKQNLPNAKLHSFPTLAFFAKMVKRQKQMDLGEDNSWKKAAFALGSHLTLEIDLSTQEMRSMSPSPRPADHICGHGAQEFESDPQFWKKLVDEGDMDELNEFFRYALLGERSEMAFLLKNSEGHKRWFRIFAREIEKDVIEWRIHDESQGSSSSKKSPLEELKQVDLAIVNTAYITADFPSWREAFLNVLRQGGLMPGTKEIKFILVNPESSQAELRDFCYRDIYGFFDKPVDRRLFIECLALSLHHKNAEFQENFMRALPYARSIEIGRPAEIVSISEYGVILRHRKAIRPGSIVNLHSPILTNEEDQPTMARCLGFELEENEEKEVYYLNHLIFFGVKDLSLKRIRKLIREEFVLKKNENLQA